MTIDRTLGARWARRGRWFGLAVLLNACPAPTVAITPTEIQVEIPATGATLKFPLNVRLHNKDGEVLAGPINWKFAGGTPPPGISLSPSTGGGIEVAVDWNVAAGAYPVEAGAGKARDVATIVVLPPTAPAGDEVVADYQSGDPTNVVVVTGDRGGCRSDSSFAFTTVARLGDWITGTACQPGRAVVFSTGRPPIVWTNPWTPFPPEDRFDVKPTPEGLTPIPVRFWALDGVTTADARFYANNDASTANGILYRNRGGLNVMWDPNVITDVAVSVTNCAGLNQAITGQDPNAPRMDPEAINVYYTPTVDGPAHGRWCSPEPLTMRPNLILLSTSEPSSAGLMHEIGHALGLKEPNRAGYLGHVNLIKGFSQANVMWGQLSDVLVANARSHLSLGQIYRMHFSQASWLWLRTKPVSTPAPPPWACSCDPFDRTVCGKLSLDARPVDDGNAILPSGLCP